MTLPASKILIADDDPAMRATLEALLQSEGYQLYFAATGPECLAQAAATVPDLILLDVIMPGLNGLEVCRQLRVDPALALVPVILVTAQEQREARMQGLEAGADDFLSKPVDTVELLARVRTITRLGRYRRVLEAQAKFQQLVEHTPDGVSLYDETGRLIEWNASLERITGLSRAEALGRFGWDVLYQLLPDKKRTPSMRERLAATLRAGLQSGQVDEAQRLAEAEIQRPDGTLRVIQTDAFVIRTEIGWRAGSVTRDITERRQLEIALHAKERLWERTMHGLLDAVFIVSADTFQILDCNPAAEDLFRYTRAEMLDRPTDFLHVDEAALAEFRRHLYTAVEKHGFLHELDFRMKRKDGTIFPTAHSVTPIEDEQRRRIVWVSVVRDLTEQKAAGAALQKRDAELVALNVENARLAQQTADVEVLRQVNRLRSELIANVSHELRTPLGLILGACTSLLRADVQFEPALQVEFLRDIEAEARRLQAIVDNLLDLSRLENKRMALNRQPAEIEPLARAALQRLAPLLAEHRLVMDFPVEPLRAEVDAKRIEQVFCNLLSNAAKYSPPGTVIVIRGQARGREIWVCVLDEGEGVPDNQRERVFERFCRVQNETTLRVAGAGLGLPICQGIVEAHGGRIWVEPRPTGGSAFCFTLPSLETQDGQ